MFKALKEWTFLITMASCYMKIHFILMIISFNTIKCFWFISQPNDIHVNVYSAVSTLFQISPISSQAFQLYEIHGKRGSLIRYVAKHGAKMFRILLYAPYTKSSRKHNHHHHRFSLQPFFHYMQLLRLLQDILQKGMWCLARVLHF